MISLRKNRQDFSELGRKIIKMRGISARKFRRNELYTLLPNVFLFIIATYSNITI